ncbi:NAD(P)(+)--arginine ADP-ribosyltransferase 2-like [Clupea harengus]|uniref:NAD(P)(+)--arginine ADP-ribosyltransferase n=1 Tax=Clupea harengus TaxID=7950 RepID=A0A6P8EEK7_CLUHA|nr:NAD(P)(+)--arginine ADP-ribosyltransferase 2-like [Clupea harengus]
MTLMTTLSFVMFATAVDAAKEDIPLNMAPDSVDDDYEGCSAEMSKLVNKKYLPSEKSDTFAEDWRKAEKAIQEKGMKPQFDNLTMNHAIAIRLYTDNKLNIYSDLIKAVRAGKKYYRTTFQYRALHFLLIDAIQRLKPKQDREMTVYRRARDKFNLNPPIRFGSFTSTSSESDLTQYGTKSCFVVLTKYGAKVSKYSKYPEENEVLIPPYEKFRIIKESSDK